MCCSSLCLLVDECVRLVSKSVKPVIIIGSQATLPPVPAEKLKEALEVRKQSFQVATCRIYSTHLVSVCSVIKGL